MAIHEHNPFDLVSESVAESVFRIQKTDECVCQLTARSKIEIALWRALAFYQPNPFNLVSQKAQGSFFCLCVQTFALCVQLWWWRAIVWKLCFLFSCKHEVIVPERSSNPFDLVSEEGLGCVEYKNTCSVYVISSHWCSTYPPTMHVYELIRPGVR